MFDCGLGPLIWSLNLTEKQEREGKLSHDIS